MAEHKINAAQLADTASRIMSGIVTGRIMQRQPLGGIEKSLGYYTDFSIKTAKALLEKAEKECGV